MLRDARLTVVKHAKDQAKARRLYSIKELSGNLDLGVNNPDITTLECALLERMYYCKVGTTFSAPPPVDKGLFAGRMQEFRGELLKRCRPATKMSLEEVVETYTGRRRTIYQNAYNHLIRIGLSRAHARSIAFVKMELVNPGKAPRCIQPRDPVYNLCLGRYVKSIEHDLYRAIGKVFGDGPTVMKGYNVSQIGGIIRGKFHSFRDPVGMGLDATKFDMHVSEAALGWEHGVYLEMFKGCRKLRKLLQWQMDNKGAGYCADGKLKYSVRGRRFSGDMNTGLGNCLLMSGMVWSYAREIGVDIKLVNNGDDCVVMMEREHLNRFQAGLDKWFLEMGFRMVCETPVYQLHEIEFCQMHPIEIGEECRMVRNLPAMLRKDTLTTHDLRNAVHREKWCTAVGTGGLWLTGGVPVAQDFYQAYQRIGCMRSSNLLDDPSFATGMRLMSRGMTEHYREPDAWTRCQVFEAWGVTPDEQEALERHYKSYVFSGVVSGDTVNELPVANLLGPM
nr:MAG: RNA-dependent RNA polymerase [Crogonang virus 164]